jgi:hypothetical protein
MDITACPECDAPAEVRTRSVWESTDGPIEHVRLDCVRGHWFLMSAASLAAAHGAPAGHSPGPAPEPAQRRGLSAVRRIWADRGRPGS